MPTLTGAACGPEGWFGFFQGESDGYMYKGCQTEELEDTINKMLAENLDLSIKVISYGEGAWFVHGENKPYNPKNRKVIVMKDINGFIIAITEQLEENRSLKVLAAHDDVWIAYFEGSYDGKRAFATADSNEEMIEKLSTKCGDEEQALRGLAYGEETWMMYFEGELLGDASWILHPNFQGFTDAVKEHAEEDGSMKVCTFNKDAGWFAYYEGKVRESDGWAWGSRPKMAQFLEHVQEQWDEDDEEGEEGSPTKAPKSPEAAAAAEESKEDDGGDEGEAKPLDKAEKKRLEAEAKKKAKEEKKLAAQKAKEEKQKAKEEKKAKKKKDTS
eukprot:m.78394 g.78394  ORF g.78394 m.78394 type:complete len:329 (+) comp12668_c0_seq2:82-1068(+)